MMLPATPFVGSFLLLLFLFLVAPMYSPYTAVAFALWCAPLCWLCSAACGLYAVTLKRTTFPKLWWLAYVLLVLSLLSLVCSTLVFNIGGWRVFAIIFPFGVTWCLMSILITIFIIAKGTRDHYTWIALATQVLWGACSFFFWVLGSGIAASC